MDRINRLEKEISDLRKVLTEKETELYQIKNELANQPQMPVPLNQTNNVSKVQISDKLPKWAIERYSRQILLAEIGVRGQERLCAARVLIVGAGGLGCPAAVYLAGAGVGEIGILDYDTVEITNIHRQILHTEKDQYMNKSDSAADYLKSINSRIKVTPYCVQLNSSNAIEIASKYNIILDCSDNVPTRYLLNDLCAILKIPLISGSALKMEGQLTIYGYRADNGDDGKVYVGPCYRCVFPVPPPSEAVGSCSANGVAGPVCGVIGVLQALEAIKYIVGQSHRSLLVERMLLFDGEDTTFRTVKLRARNPECPACSEKASISQLIDYEAFCKAQAKEKKKLEAHLNSERRKQEKKKRMTGQSYFGFRTKPDGGKRKWVQDVQKSERKMGPPCASSFCSKGTLRQCKQFTEAHREEIFKYFWNELDWLGKKKYVKNLVQSVPVKRRRIKLQNDVSRKGDSKIYHLNLNDEKIPVCRVMFLQTLGIKEAMLRCWLINKNAPKASKKPVKSLNVDNYIEKLPKIQSKCNLCLANGFNAQYLNVASVKNIFQLYNKYVSDMKRDNISPASRKTFSKVVSVKNLRIFKPKNESDICDIVSQHNVLPGLSYEKNLNQSYYVNQQWLQ